MILWLMKSLSNYQSSWDCISLWSLGKITVLPQLQKFLSMTFGIVIINFLSSFALVETGKKNSQVAEQKPRLTTTWFDPQR